MRRVLIIEDEYLLRLLLEDMLADLGYEVTETVSTVEEGKIKAETSEIDFAILDVNVAGQRVFPVCEVLKERGLPFCFITGYGASALPEQYLGVPTLQKPFQIADLKMTLTKLNGATADKK